MKYPEDLRLAYFIRIAEENTFDKIADLQAALARRLTDKIDSFSALADRRPLLLREQFECDSLKKIAALSQYDEILALRRQIAAQPTDEAVKRYLLFIVDEKAELYKAE